MRFVLLICAGAACHADGAEMPVKAQLGTLDFSITGSPACQATFREGMLALHSFEYDRAHAVFGRAIAAGNCAMAAWGDAMAYDHAIWKEQDTVNASAALAQVTAADEATLSAKERAYFAAARALFAKGTLAKAGRAQWLEHAAQMHREYPSDDEVVLQHALALIAVYGYDPKHVREQVEAGSLALGVLSRRPDHPGAAHYAIHALDSRDLAILALPAARTYAKIAPAAGHAQHMPSHTFAHLGMWRDVVPSNERATAAATANAKADGKGPIVNDWHSYSWLVAALLELGRFDRAKQLIADARAILVAAGTNDETAGVRYDYANMVAMYVTQTARWAELPDLAAPVLTPVKDEDGAHVACAMHAPGGAAAARMPTAQLARMTIQRVRAEAAILAKDPAAVAARVAELRTIRDQIAAWKPVMDPEFDAEWDAIATELTTRASGDPVPALRDRIAREAKQQSVGPGWHLTGRELLAAELLATKPAEALALYEADLAERPNRAIALAGAVRAATALGDTARATAFATTLVQAQRE